MKKRKQKTREHEPVFLVVVKDLGVVCLLGNVGWDREMRGGKYPIHCLGFWNGDRDREMMWSFP
jgi:hypothetical protein